MSTLKDRRSKRASRQQEAPVFPGAGRAGFTSTDVARPRRAGQESPGTCRNLLSSCGKSVKMNEVSVSSASAISCRELPGKIRVSVVLTFSRRSGRAGRGHKLSLGKEE